MPIKNQINREARGFLDLFRAKAGGEQPQRILENVQPVIDVTPFVADSLLVAAFATSTNGTSVNTSNTVPASQTWMVYGVTATIAAYTGTADLALSVRLTVTIPGSTEMYLGNKDVVTVSTLLPQRYKPTVHWTPPAPLNFPPGTVFKSYYEGTISTSVQSSVMYAKLIV